MMNERRKLRPGPDLPISTELLLTPETFRILLETREPTSEERKEFEGKGFKFFKTKPIGLNRVLAEMSESDVLVNLEEPSLIKTLESFIPLN